MKNIHRQLAIGTGDRIVRDPWDLGIEFTLIPLDDPDFKKWQRERLAKDPVSRKVLNATSKHQVGSAIKPPGAPSTGTPKEEEAVPTAAEELLNAVLDSVDFSESDLSQIMQLADPVEATARRIRAWSGIEGDDGSPWECSLENRRELLTDRAYLEPGQPYAGQTLGAAFCEFFADQFEEMKTVNGVKAQALQEARKNSDRSTPGEGDGPTSTN